MSRYNDYTIYVTEYHNYTTKHARHVHNTTCTTYTYHHLYTTPVVQHVHNITYKTCTHDHMYTTPLCNLYTSSHVHNTTYTMYTQHHMCIAPLAQCVHNNICTQQRIYNMYNSNIAHQETNLTLPSNLLVSSTIHTCPNMLHIAFLSFH